MGVRGLGGFLSWGRRSGVDALGGSRLYLPLPTSICNFMKLPNSALVLSLAPLLLALPVVAQTAPPAAPLLPPPAAAAGPAAEPPLGPFKDQKERRSYGLGSFLGSREKTNASANLDKPTVDVAELLAGLKDGLGGTKTMDYAGGLAMAAQVKRSGVDIDPAVLAEAVRGALENQPAKIGQADIQAIMQELQTSIQQKQQAKMKVEAEKNLALANTWLAENAKKEGVKATASGLQYVLDTPGEGRTPGARDVVTVNLVGTSVDGTEFDRSAEGSPARRALMSLPKGLQEGLQMMKAGGKAHFWLPPALGFGESPRGAGIKPNAVLAYTVELVSSEEPPVAQAGTSLGPDGKPVPQGKREPITAVTPPVSVEIPPNGGQPKIKVEAQPKAPAAPKPESK